MHMHSFQEDVAAAWTGEAYTPGFTEASRLLRHLPAAHAAAHLVKAAAKVIAAIEPGDHGGVIDMHAIERALGDVVICAAAVANKLPHPLDLELAAHSRLAEIEKRQNAEQHQKA